MKERPYLTTDPLTQIVDILKVEESLAYALASEEDNISTRRVIVQEFWAAMNRRNQVANEDVERLVKTTLSRSDMIEPQLSRVRSG